MNQPIKNVRLSFSCNQNWNAMPGVEGGRQCDKCTRTVYDLTNGTAADLEKLLLQNNNSICARFKAEQLAAPLLAPRLPFWKKWLSAAMVFIGFNFMADKIQAQVVKQANDTTQNKTATPQYESVKQESFGTVETEPVFPGGKEALKAFITKNLDRSKASAPVRVMLTFVIEKNGSLTNIRPIGRITDQAAVDEAIRVMKLSPKWIPGKQLERTVRVQYMVPVFFN